MVDQPPAPPTLPASTVQYKAVAAAMNKTRRMLKYVMAGFAVFPLTHDRTPTKKGWQLVKPDPLFNSKDYPWGYGIVLPASMFVLDYDPRRDKEGVQLNQLWQKLALAKTNTYIVRTGRNGLHIYFRKPSEFKVRSVVPGFPAIEIKTLGRYVLGPGSPHPTGKTYTVEQGTLDAIEDAPQKLLDYCKRTGPEKTKQSEAAIEVDDEFTRNRYTKYLKQSAEKGSFEVACEGKAYGLAADSIVELMLEHYNNERTSGPKSREEIETKVNNAFHYSTEEQGSRTVQADFADSGVIEMLELENEPDGEPEQVEFTEREIAIASLTQEELADIQRAHRRNQLINDRFDKRGKDQLEKNMNNGVCYLRQEPHKAAPGIRACDNPLFKLFRYNEFTGNVEFSRRAPWHKEDRLLWSDNDALQLKDWFAFNRPYDASTATMHEVAKVAALDNSYHPIRQWLKSLVWDGQERLDRWLPTYCGSPNTAIVREFGKNTLIAACARTMEPGCQHDSMLVLEGPQWTGKTTVCRILGGDWFVSAKIEVDSAQGYVRTVSVMRGGWIIECPEMEVTSKADVQSLKAFLTTLVDVVRLAYGHTESVLKRQSIFIGTYNPSEKGYLKDITGNRRFWPVATTTIDTEALATDRGQLFAEAFARYQNGEKWWITDEKLRQAASDEQMQRLEHDDWCDIIKDWIERAGKNAPRNFTTHDIAYTALGIMPSSYTKPVQSRLVDVIVKLGYKSTTKSIDGVRRRIWIKAVVDSGI